MPARLNIVSLTKIYGFWTLRFTQKMIANEKINDGTEASKKTKSFFFGRKIKYNKQT